MATDQNFKISPNFSFYELTTTNHADLSAANRVLPQGLFVAMNALVWGLLQPIRSILRERVIVHSGFRCTKLNEAVGGSPTSQHVYFEAADFHVENLDNKAVGRFVEESGLPFGQLIVGPQHVHISLPAPFRDKPGGEVLDPDYNIIRRIP